MDIKEKLEQHRIYSQVAYSASDPDRHKEAARKRDSVSQEIIDTHNALLKACKKFSKAHGYPDPETAGAFVDPQDWAEFDAAIKRAEQAQGEGE